METSRDDEPGRLYRVLMGHHARAVRAPHVPRLLRVGWRRWAATFRPGYDPADIDPPPQLQGFLDTVAAGRIGGGG
jgi:hypothetical protein